MSRTRPAPKPRPRTANPRPRTADPQPPRDGAEGWDQYAPFYDWENAQTVGRRDVPFWTRLAGQARGRVLELGCGTGRVSIPLARAGIDLVGIDRSLPMLERARTRAARTSRSPARTAQSPTPNPQSPLFLRGDIRALPFDAASFDFVLAPYGILQSLTRPRDLTAALQSVSVVLAPGGTFGIDLVPDVPNWKEYQNRVQLRGRTRGARLTLVESVSQDPRRRLTVFHQRYIERRGRDTREHAFTLTFRTLTVPEMTRQLERAGFAVDAVLGDYRGRPWDARAGVWIILAKKV